MQPLQTWRFLTPAHLPWTLRRLRELVVDRATGAPPRTERARRFVEEHARAGDPDDVLRALDRFAREVRFLMSVGPEKGPLMAELLDPLPAGARVLELGAYCGYSAILIAQHLGPQGRLVSVENDPVAVEVARANVAHAGLADRVQVVEGASTEVIPSLTGPFDLVFLDHWKDLYATDLKRIEACGLLRPGSTVVADNVGEVFGAAKYLDYVRGCGRYDSQHRPATIEYSAIPDAVEISIYRGESVPRSSAVSRGEASA
jgi:catechol O-methyltransferase